MSKTALLARPHSVARPLSVALPLALSLTLLQYACGDSTGPAAPEEARLTTTAAAYALDPVTGEATVGFAIENPSSETVYPSACGELPAPWAERREGGRWNRFSVTSCDTPVTDLPLAAGSTVTGAYVIGEPGEYRLAVTIRARASGDEAWLHVSEPFMVE